MKQIDFSFFAGLKGEFEAEGLTRRDVATESLFAARRGLDYLVKIGGCEAKSDLNYLMDLGITSVVAPMIETPFAMQKYMEMLPQGAFEHVGVTIETVTAVANIEEILEKGTKLTEVTVGRTDLTASYGGASVDSPETIDMVKKVGRIAKSRGLKMTMGGSVNKNTRDVLEKDKDLFGMIDYIETRKAIMPVSKFLKADALLNALKLEAYLLGLRAKEAERVMPLVANRKSSITSRA